MSRTHNFVLVLMAATTLSCGGGGSYDNGITTPKPPPPPPPPPGIALGSVVVVPASVDLSAGGLQALSVQALDTKGQLIDNAPEPAFASTNSSIVEVDAPGDVIALSAGDATIHVSVTLNGVTKSADVAVTVTGILPQSGDVVAGTDYLFTPRTIVIAQGGSVRWQFGAVEHTVTFSAGQAGAPPSIGNSYNTAVTETFTEPGTYSYHCSIHPTMTGQVIVR
jgi:plastocyanin